jgi:hypothetical protein
MTKAEMLALADFLAEQNAYHSNSMACHDPIIQAHVQRLSAWEKAVRLAAQADAPDGQPQSPQQPQTLAGMIAAIYGYFDAEDCARIDREWARQRGFILPTDGTCTLTRLQHGAEEKVARIKAIGDEIDAALSDTRPLRGAE